MSDELERIPKELWNLAMARERVVAPLADHSRVPLHAIERAAKKLGLGTSMVFRLLARYRREHRTSTLVPGRPGRKSGCRILDPKQEELITAAINKFYLQPERPSLAALSRKLLVLCRKAGVKAPSYKAIQRRVSEFDPRTLLSKRHGAKAATQRLKALKAGVRVNAPLELVQIDHTPMDIIVVDEIDRQPVGRPWITLAMDVFTRMVLGFHLALDSPNSTSVALALAMAVLPKDEFLKELELDLPWLARGLPRTVHVDNAHEFRFAAIRSGRERIDEESLRLLPSLTPLLSMESKPRTILSQ